MNLCNPQWSQKFKICIWRRFKLFLIIHIHSGYLPPRDSPFKPWHDEKEFESNPVIAEVANKVFAKRTIGSNVDINFLEELRGTTGGIDIDWDKSSGVYVLLFIYSRSPKPKA